jgi:hypothetical protein
MKSIIVCVFFGLLPLPVLSQLMVGVKAGTVLSTTNKDGHLNLKGGRVGYVAGMQARKYVGELGWWLQAEAVYAAEGDNEEVLRFAKIPLVAGFDAGADVNIHVAYTTAFLVGGTDDVMDYYERVSHVLSLGMEAYAGERWVIGGRLNYTVSNLVEVPLEAKFFNVHPLTFELYAAFWLLR